MTLVEWSQLQQIAILCDASHFLMSFFASWNTHSGLIANG